jgi:hypothetical protein
MNGEIFLMFLNYFCRSLFFDILLIEWQLYKLYIFFLAIAKHILI